MFGVAPFVSRLEHFGPQAVNNEPPLTFLLDKIRVMQNPEVMRDGDHLDIEGGCQFTHVPRTGAQHIDDPQP